MNSTLTKYDEIRKLKDFCIEHEIVCIFERFLDGWALRFNCGADVVQHKGSYGSGWGCVEFGYTYTDIDFTAVTLDNAKKFILENKDYLNREKL